jgi:hypothetical protein
VLEVPGVLSRIGKPDVSKTLAKFDELLPDRRIRKIYDALMELYPDLGEAQIATYVQPEQMIERDDGITLKYPAQAVFLMTSPNPHPRHVGDIVKTNAFTDLRNWREEEYSTRHSSDTDLALNFFKAIAREHRAVLANWRELN